MFVTRGARVVDLDGDSHWSTEAVCRCGEGYLFSCHGVAAEGVAAGQFSPVNELGEARAGQVVIVWNLENTSQEEAIPDRLHVRSMGRATSVSLRS